jgi:hypothetical protein
MNLIKSIIAAVLITGIMASCRYKKVEITPDPDFTPGSTSNISQTQNSFATTEKKIYIRIYDWSDKDNDIISVSKNNRVIELGVNINTEAFIEVSLDKGSNEIEMGSVSVGGAGGLSSPNISICMDKTNCSVGQSYALPPDSVVTYIIVRN